MFEGKRALVTGGAGFVGANLLARLLDLGVEVRATLHRKDAVIKHPDVEYIWCDLRRPEDCKLVCQDIDYAFLCAATTAGAGMMETKPLFLLTPNIVMNTLMLEALYEAAVSKVLFISSSTVYPLTDYPVTEHDVTGEFFPKYFAAGSMKRFSEIMCEMYSTKISKPMQTLIARPSNIYGPHDDFEWETSHVLPAFIRRVVERHDPIDVWGDGNDIKDFIFIDDFVQGLLLAMQSFEGFDIVNIASGRGYRLREILHLIMELDGYQDARVVYDTSKPTMIPKRLMDPSKAEQLFRFKATTEIAEGLKTTVDWYRSTL